ncbi:cytochrome c oxidase assembly factor Coa1 family protein [Flavobacterium tructae]|uniref:cytochrome c oxidase assembly factor Coa1 family protein n=1 Tax=Flavobacterium tructae TaxID=1114873 RepID=UPI002551CB0D|nr:cytochrome c oxidase assembly factor Coa1 family protein [Flavobacterium tructae]MDL2143875.1 cytochrome c oxidase assembly factor Coa1 family protein [Flavobacterium tructae]
MENDLIEKENWFKRNWKWFLPSAFLCIFLIGILAASTSQDSITDIAKAYSDELLFEKAIEQANKNPSILENIGTIEPIDKLAILEGNVMYSNNHNTVNLSVRVNGAKKKGKLNISAFKKGTEWVYQKIAVRTKNPKNEIIVLEKPQK